VVARTNRADWPSLEEDEEENEGTPRRWSPKVKDDGGDVEGDELPETGGDCDGVPIGGSSGVDVDDVASALMDRLGALVSAEGVDVALLMKPCRPSACTTSVLLWLRLRRRASLPPSPSLPPAPSPPSPSLSPSLASVEADVGVVAPLSPVAPMEADGFVRVVDAPPAKDPLGMPALALMASTFFFRSSRSSSRRRSSSPSSVPVLIFSLFALLFLSFFSELVTPSFFRFGATSQYEVMKKKMETLGREMKDGKMGRGPQAWDRRNNNL
jgi:hypothetical protein